MDALKLNRELDALDKLERRLREMVQPDMVLLNQVKERRGALLSSKPVVPEKEDKAGRPR